MTTPSELDIDGALDTFALNLETPTWDDMVQQAGDLKAVTQQPTLSVRQKGLSKHSYETREGRGGQGRGRGTPRRMGQPAGKGLPPAFKVKEEPSAPGPPPLHHRTLSSALSSAGSGEEPGVPASGALMEEDIDRLSQATSDNEERIGKLEGDLGQARGIINLLLQDQRELMSKLSSVEKELASLQIRMNKGDKRESGSSGDLQGLARVGGGKEIVPAPPASRSADPDPMVAGVPAWRRAKNI
jgi:hypothetical protein